ncbi:MAG: multiheme c-type cytochrome, partial [bacterium]
MKRRLATAARRALGGLVSAAWLVAGCRADSASIAAVVPEASYVDAALCLGCHPAEAARWKGSHHDRAMQVATPATVEGDFGGAAIDDTRFRRDGDAHLIDVTEGGATRSHRVRYTFGVEPLQQLLVERPGGRLQASAFAWDTAKRAWFRVQSAELPWTSRYQTWNTMCAECHSTAVDKRYDPDAD